ncbi:MAG: hypothetical protein WBX25_09160 [Rhodomicrobium sp.]
MNVVVEFDCYRQKHLALKSSVPITADMAASLCEAAFNQKDWPMFDRYFRIVKALRSPDCQHGSAAIYRICRDRQSGV